MAEILLSTIRSLHESQIRSREFYSMMSVTSLSSMDKGSAMDFLGHLSDVSFELKQSSGIKHAIRLAIEIGKSSFSDGFPLWAHFFIANSWERLRLLRTANEMDITGWEQKELENELYHLDMALNLSESISTPAEYKARLLANKAAVLHHMGRPQEALELWDEALIIQPDYTLALAKRGYALSQYAQCLIKDSHRETIMLESALCLKQAMTMGLSGPTRKMFEQRLFWVLSRFSKASEQKTMHSSSPRIEGQDKWFSDNRLFLNPLNDIGQAYNDVSMVDFMSRTNPSAAIMLNAVLQLYTEARKLIYECSRTGMAECLVYAREMIESLNKRIAVFINFYLGLGIPTHSVSLSNLWFVRQNKDKGIRPEFQNMKNWPLRGLYFMSMQADVGGRLHAFNQSAQGTGHDHIKQFKRNEYVPAKLESTNITNNTLGKLKQCRSLVMCLMHAISQEERSSAFKR